MKPLIQKLPVKEDNSFVAQTFRTPAFEVGWHQHIECELILFTEGSGMSFVGNDIGKFDTGDVYLLGANLPHTFQKSSAELITSAIVVQFRENCWGDSYLELPECRSIRKLLADATFGLKINGTSRQLLQPLIKILEATDGFRRFLLLGECLDIIASRDEYSVVSTKQIQQLNNKGRECIDRIFQFTIDNFRESVTLRDVAGVACMSIPAFCTYFKKCTKKTYIDFLNEIRVSYACSLLMETEKTVLEVSYDSGYSTVANFHKQFRKIKDVTPLQFRKCFTNRLS